MRATNSKSGRRSSEQFSATSVHKQWKWVLALMLLAPLELGAKGCEVGVVGDECPEGADPSTNPNCVPSNQKACGGLQGLACDSGQYCNYAPDAQCGAADRTGVCAAIPEACADIYQPVCGCDDKTYGNSCEAAGAGVSVAHEGECKPTGGTRDCGGLLGLACQKGEYCNYAPGTACGAADQTGTCAAIPEACTTEYNPVCGCDGKTYGNACGAAMAGVSVASKGECGVAGAVCGGLTGAGCADGEFCNYAPESRCGAADQTGTCTTIPEVCTDDYNPVCGCDGKTYSNACAAAGAGVSVAASGECKPPVGGGDTCGGITGASCEKGQYCAYPLSSQCGAGDQTGACRPIPEACDTVYDPVCGCDNKTYGNACSAAMAGVSVMKEGECATTRPCGTRGGETCAEDEYCNFSPGDNCGRADAPGVCATKPQGCTKELNQVCGCNGITYGNPCMAAAAGVSVDYPGPCK